LYSSIFRAIPAIAHRLLDLNCGTLKKGRRNTRRWRRPETCYPSEGRIRGSDSGTQRLNECSAPRLWIVWI